MGNVYGQESYQIEFDNLNYRINKGVKNSTSSNIHIKVHFNDGTEETLYYRDIRNRGDNESNYGIQPIIRSIRPNKISSHAFVNFRTGTDANETKNITINTPCVEGSFDGGYSPRMTHITFDYKVIPILDLLQPTSTLIGFDDNFTVSTDNNSLGFPTSFYNWQYQTVASGTPSSTGWANMPSSTNGQSSFSITPSSFLNVNDIGKRVYFRIKTCNGFFSENVIFYDLHPSAPHISSKMVEDVQCFDTEDGTIKINFDRALTSGELLSISMTNTTTGIDYSEENITNLEADNSYLIENIPPGDYTLRLLGAVPDFNGTLINTFTDGTNHKTTFTINKPVPVEFSSTKVAIWCNGGSDGVITITANGGQLFQPYEYLLREVGETSENWVSFTSTATFPNSEVTETITGLLPKSYTLKVRDSNGCVAKVIQRDGNGQIVGLGAEINEEITISQPDAPLSVVFPSDGFKSLQPLVFLMVLLLLKLMVVQNWQEIPIILYGSIMILILQLG